MTAKTIINLIISPTDNRSRITGLRLSQSDTRSKLASGVKLCQSFHGFTGIKDDFMPNPRKAQVSLDVATYYHCVSPAVCAVLFSVGRTAIPAKVTNTVIHGLRIA